MSTHNLCFEQKYEKKKNQNFYLKISFFGGKIFVMLNMDESDKDLLLEILKLKLSTASVEQMKLYTYT